MSRPACARASAAAGVLAGLAALVLAAPAATAAEAGDTVQDRRLLDPRITESSGLAASNLHENVLWTHNDSGSRARIYAVGRDGRTRADFLLAGVEPRDWEGMAASRDAAGKSWLWIGDIGDNSSTRRQGILVHRVAEPPQLGTGQSGTGQSGTGQSGTGQSGTGQSGTGRPSTGTLQPTSYRLRYPDAPRDAEALLVHPKTGRLYIVSKGVFGGTVYRAPAELRSDRPNELERLGSAPAVVTDGVFLPDGRAVLLGYSDFTVVPSLDDDDGENRSVPVEKPSGGTLGQSESVALGPEGTVLVGTEGVNSRVLRVRLPDAPRQQPGAGQAVQDVAEGAVERARSLPPVVLAVGAVAGGVLIAALVRRRRR